MFAYTKRLIRFESPGPKEWVIYFILFTLLHVPAILNFYDNNGMNNAYLRFSESILHGQFTLPQMSSYDDMIFYKDAYYLPYPPFPALILAPLTAVFGAANVNTVLIVIILSCLNLFLVYRILKQTEVPQSLHSWLIVAFFFGSPYWFALFTSHHVYSFAHIISVTLQLLAINEILYRKRWWLVGLLIGGSFLTRQFTFLYLIFALGYLIYHHRIEKNAGQTVKNSIVLLGSFGIVAIIYLAYNYVRFGNPLDTGYSYILFNGVLRERVATYGVFSWRYMPFNLYTFFIKGFDIEFKGKRMMQIEDMNLWGTSLLSASPFIVASVKSNWHKMLNTATWLTILSILSASLFYHNNGYHQINTMRFSLDFFPLLFVLILLGIKFLPGWLLKGMIGYAVILNIISFIIHYIYQ